MVSESGERNVDTALVMVDVLEYDRSAEGPEYEKVTSFEKENPGFVTKPDPMVSFPLWTNPGFPVKKKGGGRSIS